jgi:hypothetical protein
MSMKLGLTNWGAGFKDECECTLGLQEPALDWTIDPAGVAPDDPVQATIQRKKALNIIKVNTSPEMMVFIKPADGPLEELFAGSQGARVLQLKSAFNKSTMKKDENIASFSTRILRQSQEITQAGGTLTRRHAQGTAEGV